MEIDRDFLMRCMTEIAGTVQMLAEETRGEPMRALVLATELLRQGSVVLGEVYPGDPDAAREHIRRMTESRR